MRIVLQLATPRHSWDDLHRLLTQLREAGVPVVGGGFFGGQYVLLIDREGDAERAMTLLAKLGINADCG
jgi:hypothetical protein